MRVDHSCYNGRRVLVRTFHAVVSFANRFDASSRNFVITIKTVHKFVRVGAVVGPSPDTFQIKQLDNLGYVEDVSDITYDGEKAGVVLTCVVSLL